jgi:hypothetical protein
VGSRVSLAQKDLEHTQTGLTTSFDFAGATTRATHSCSPSRSIPDSSAPSAIVHLRYLAVVLRVADILDPERTPDVILRHRGVAPRSLDYWWKDHYPSFALNEKRS